MNRSRITALAFVVTLSMATLLLLSGAAAAQSAQVQGVINGRSGTTMTVQTDAGNVVVVLNDYTEVEDVSGVFHARKKQMGVTALVPGLKSRCREITTPKISWWPTPSSSTAKACKPLPTFRLA